MIVITFSYKKDQKCIHERNNSEEITITFTLFLNLLL